MQRETEKTLRLTCHKAFTTSSVLTLSAFVWFAAQSANNQPVSETGLRPLSCSLLSCGHVYRLRLRFCHMTRVRKILCRPEIFHVCRSQSARLHVFQRVTVNAFGAFYCIPAQLKPPVTFTEREAPPSSLLILPSKRGLL